MTASAQTPGAGPVDDDLLREEARRVEFEASTARERRAADRRKKKDMTERRRTRAHDDATSWDFLFCNQVTLEGPEEGSLASFGVCCRGEEAAPRSPRTDDRPFSGNRSSAPDSDGDDEEEEEEVAAADGDDAEVIDATPEEVVARETRRRLTNKSRAVLHAHSFRAVNIVKPHWCHNCGGVIVGAAFKCSGPCGYVCHHGLGKGTENCHADLLLTECARGAPRAKAVSEFGDVARQLKREAHQLVKDKVVEATVEEQREWGKFDLLKVKAATARDWWDTEWVHNTAQTTVFTLALALFLLTGGVAGVARHFDGRASRIGYVVAITAAAFVFLLEVVLLYLIRWAARWLLKYTEIVHSFVREMIHVDLAEDLEICLDDCLRIVRDLATSLLYGAATGLLATSFAWVLAVQHVD